MIKSQPLTSLLRQAIDVYFGIPNQKFWNFEKKRKKKNTWTVASTMIILLASKHLGYRLLLVCERIINCTEGSKA